MKGKGQKPLQWHPAFYAGIQIELEDEAENLVFENEHQLGTKPKEIDVVVVKKHSDIPVQKNIGKLFRKHNIIEYKSPDDYISIDDFYLVYAYACLYKSDTIYADEISAEEITISFVCSTYPYKMIKHLKESRQYNVEKVESGIYYLHGDFFPIQIICIKELSEESNFWLRNLTNDINDSQRIKKIVYEYQKHSANKIYASVMNIIVTANKEKFKEVTDMCEALEELFMEKHRAEFEKEKLAAIQIALAEKDDTIAEQAALIAQLQEQLMNIKKE